MRIIVLGDIHGRTIWNDIVQKERFDKVIFIGDYFDAKKDKTGSQAQLNNFLSICEYKSTNVSNVILLFGNHDFQYLEGMWEEYNTFNSRYASRFRNAMKEPLRKKWIQMCYVHDNILFTHAGVTKTWCKEAGIDTSNIEQSINDLFISRPEDFNCFPIYREDGPKTEENSPIWVRPHRLLPDKVDGYIQVVGHTMLDSMVFGEGCIFIDTLGTSGEYLVIEDGEFYAGKV